MGAEAAPEGRSPLPGTELGRSVPRLPPCRAAPEDKAEGRAVVVAEGTAFRSACGAERRDRGAPVAGCGTLIGRRSHFPTPEGTLCK